MVDPTKWKNKQIREEEKCDKWLRTSSSWSNEAACEQWTAFDCTREAYRSSSRGSSWKHTMWVCVCVCMDGQYTEGGVWKWICVRNSLSVCVSEFFLNPSPKQRIRRIKVTTPNRYCCGFRWWRESHTDRDALAEAVTMTTTTRRERDSKKMIKVVRHKEKKEQKKWRRRWRRMKEIKLRWTKRRRRRSRRIKRKRKMRLMEFEMKAWWWYSWPFEIGVENAKTESGRVVMTKLDERQIVLQVADTAMQANQSPFQGLARSVDACVGGCKRTTERRLRASESGRTFRPGGPRAIHTNCGR